MFDYQKAFEENIDKIKREGRYRKFTPIERNAQKFPKAFLVEKDKKTEITLWCSNDYLGQGCNPIVLDAMQTTLRESGAGAGGTRNISGNNIHHLLLEECLATYHKKENALLFTSGYIANEAAISVLAKTLPQCIIFSDEKNHASIIQGIRASGVQKHIFKHNDLRDLENKLKLYPTEQPKIIIFESVYSMDGDFGDIQGIVNLAKKYNALTYLDEVHAVGMYGETGAGLAEKLGLEKEIDIIQGTLGKAIGCIGGYIASTNSIVDTIRSNASGFIFTTSLPPIITKGAQVSIEYLRGPEGKKIREKHQKIAQFTKQRLLSEGFPILDCPSHIIPFMVKDTHLCTEIAKNLLQDFQIYIQPINYPTVAKGQERLRITPTPFHNEEHVEELIKSLKSVWGKP